MSSQEVWTEAKSKRTRRNERKAVLDAMRSEIESESEVESEPNDPRPSDARPKLVRKPLHIDIPSFEDSLICYHEHTKITENMSLFTGVPSGCPYTNQSYDEKRCWKCGCRGEYYKVCPILKVVECPNCDKLKKACGSSLHSFHEGICRCFFSYGEKSKHHHHTVNQYCPCVFNVAYIEIPNSYSPTYHARVIPHYRGDSTAKQLKLEKAIKDGNYVPSVYVVCDR